MTAFPLSGRLRLSQYARQKSKLAMADVSPHAHPAIHSLCAILGDKGVTLTEAGARAGVTDTAIINWKYAKASPTLNLLECVANGVGYTLALIPISPPPRQDQVAASGGRVTPSSHTAANLSEAP